MPETPIHPYRIHQQNQDPIGLPNSTGQVVVLNDEIYHVTRNFTHLISKEKGVVRVDAGYKMIPEQRSAGWPSENFQAITYHDAIYIFDDNKAYEVGKDYTIFEFSVDDYAIVVYHGIIHIIGKEHYTWDGKTVTHIGHNSHHYDGLQTKAVVYEDQIHILHGNYHLVYDDDMAKIEFEGQWPLSTYHADSNKNGPFMIVYRDAIHLFGKDVHFIWEPDRIKTFPIELGGIDLMIPYKGTILVRCEDKLFEYDKYLSVYLDEGQILKYPEEDEMPVFYPSDQVEWLSENTVRVKKSGTYRIYNFDGLL